MPNALGEASQIIVGWKPGPKETLASEEASTNVVLSALDRFKPARGHPGPICVSRAGCSPGRLIRPPFRYANTFLCKTGNG
jgi:hypothetical protein